MRTFIVTYKVRQKGQSYFGLPIARTIQGPSTRAVLARVGTLITNDLKAKGGERAKTLDAAHIIISAAPPLRRPRPQEDPA